VVLCAGYVLPGASWVVKKCEADARDAAYRAIAPWLLVVLVLLIVLFFHALYENFAIMHRWLDHHYLFLVPSVALGAIADTLTGVRRRRDNEPFLMIVLLFICAYVMLTIPFWPYLEARLLSARRTSGLVTVADQRNRLPVPQWHRFPHARR
jgi:cytochrome bd ubiquinol oxidase subunit II